MNRWRAIPPLQTLWRRPMTVQLPRQMKRNLKSAGRERNRPTATHPSRRKRRRTTRTRWFLTDATVMTAGRFVYASAFPVRGS